MPWSIFFCNKRASLYLHFPCFDGVISGVLAILFLEKTRGWRFKTLEPVNYELKDRWLATPLPGRSAVVDFLYHPQAGFWADHHSTTFLTDEAKADFEERQGPSRIYDRQSGSCASLLWREVVGLALHGASRLEEMVHWAEKIDSAGYDSVQEAISSEHPAMIISSSLAIAADREYCNFLVRKLCQASLAETAAAAAVQQRSAQASELKKLGLERMRVAARLEHGVVISEVNTEGSLVNRYSPYYFFPQADYSIAILHSKDAITVTAMRNPWRNFESVNLGEFMRQFGGGGHQRVGSVILGKDDIATARVARDKLLQELRQTTGRPQ